MCARELLIRRAVDAGAGDPTHALLTYAAFCNDVDPGQRYWRPPRFGGVAKVLSRIGTYEHAGGRPLLTALIVQAGTRRAGSGFAELARRLGTEVTEDQEGSFWRAQVREVVRYWAGRGLTELPGDDAGHESVVVVPAVGADPGPEDVRRYWWQGLSGENVFMEITRRGDIGIELNAPSPANGGSETASYVLVSLVGSGDVVIHYDSRSEAIAGVSVAAGGPEPVAVRSAVQAGSRAGPVDELPRWLPGVRVPLVGYRPLEPPLTLAEIRVRADELLALRTRLETVAAGQPVHFPWIPYQEDTIDIAPSYLARMPREAVSLFPTLEAAVGRAATEPVGLGSFTLVQMAEDAVTGASGNTTGVVGGQGFQLDQAAKVAIELCAMNAAIAHYETSWAVEDVHGSESFDLLCRRGNELMYVEVKGTTTAGTDVILTRNEVTHAREHEHSALFILRGITLERTADGKVIASGGVPCVRDPWHIDDEGTLMPIAFRYRIHE